MVSRLALIKELASIVTEDVLVVSSIGNNSAFWGELAERESNLFHATLGMCSPAALGLAPTEIGELRPARWSAEARLIFSTSNVLMPR